MPPGPREHGTRFLNVDLELVATTELKPLLEHLAGATITLRNSSDGEWRIVWLELADDPRDADDAILHFARLIESLPPDARRLWNRCDDRCLNVGIQGGPVPHASAFRISANALGRLAAITARLEVTVYGSGGDQPEAGAVPSDDRSR